ncbi:MAG: transposase [Acidobacteriota bacterium]|nr:MAG: transposase [Acidobacteriota bacterium]
MPAYILRPSFAGTRLHYDADNGRIEYRTTKGLIRHMDAPDWIALVTSHIPDSHQQMVRYYGRYSNASRGKRRKQGHSPPGAIADESSPQPTHPPGILPGNGAATGPEYSKRSTGCIT